MLKPISNGPIPPASPVKQLILRLAGELARLHDSQPSTLDLIDEARAYLAQPEPEGPTDEELLATAKVAEHQYLTEHRPFQLTTVDGVLAVLNGKQIAFARAVLARWGK
jgi:hypothetical protein